MTAHSSTKNSAKTAARKVVGRPFKKGQTGNPGGRPKKTQEEYDLEAACKLKSEAALGVIEKLMAAADKDSVKLAAATFILERAYGKAVQKSEVTGKDGGPLALSLAVEFV